MFVIGDRVVWPGQHTEDGPAMPLYVVGVTQSMNRVLFHLAGKADGPRFSW